MEFNSFQIKQVLSECKAFGSAYRSMYPNFVFGKDLDEGATPVFFYHRTEAELFRQHLLHLKTNGYITLNCDELYETIRNPQLADRRKIVLTFDDGLDDLYSVVYPLLREFHFTAVAYIVPAWIGNKGFLTWPQVQEMHQSGYIDFQSHSMSHSFVFTSPKIVDFLHPRFLGFIPAGTELRSQRSSNPMVRIPPLGSPVYTWSSRLSDSRRYLSDEAIESLCSRYVNENGYKAFFEKYGWRRKLRRLITSHQCQRNDIYETDAEREQAIMDEIDKSKRAIEQNLPNKIVEHFAFPWHEAGQLAKKMLIGRGYKTIGLGLLRNTKHRMVGSRSFEVFRINGDFVPALPGNGRKHFGSIISYKIRKRIRER